MGEKLYAKTIFLFNVKDILTSKKIDWGTPREDNRSVENKDILTI